MRRREFLKNTAIAGTAVSMAPIVEGLSYAATSAAKSRVVIAKDPQCFVNNTANAALVQEMVDQAIMALTGKSEKGAAWEALFPKPVTTATTIVIKSNETTGTQASMRSYATVKNAVKTGLRSMLNGAFPAGNIKDFIRNDSAANSNPQFSLGTYSYRVKDMFMNNDYFINIPICWATQADSAGVSMSLKHMMSSVSGTLNNFHNFFLNSSTPALSLCNGQSVFKAKQVLVLQDAIQINSKSGPATAPSGQAYAIVASKDMIAADYQGMLILKTNGLPASCENAAKTVFDNAAKAPYSLGVSNPNDMEVINISPPWATSVAWQSRVVEDLGISVNISRRSNRPHVEFTLKDKNSGPVELAIFALDGARIWVSNTLEWNGEALDGRLAGTGIYLYTLKIGNQALNGKISIMV